jgi:hypothetical protein
LRLAAAFQHLMVVQRLANYDQATPVNIPSAGTRNA